MSFFSKKQEVNLESVNRIFYENVILDCIVDGVDVNALFFETLKNALIEADRNFANVDSQKFIDEIIALQFELFALAWFHQFGEGSSVIQTTFTKNYLNNAGKDKIWSSMQPYEQAIARSATAGRNPDNSSDKMYMLQLDKKKVDLFGKFIEEGYNEECIARALGLLSTDIAWSKGITAGLLLFTLCDRLGLDPDFQPNDKAHSRWFIEINDFYDKAKKSLSNIKIK